MRNLTELLNEDTPLLPVQQASKQEWWFLASVLIGITICVPVFVMGAELAHKLPFSQFVLGVFLGGVLAAAIAIATGIVGQKTGLPTAMLAKIAFGSKGYIIANVAMLIGSVGWFGIQTSVFSEAFVKLAEQVWGLSLNETMVMIISGIVMSTTAVIGFRGLGRLTYIALPLLIVMLLIPLYVFYQDGQLLNLTPFSGGNAMGMGTLIAIVAGAYSFSTTMPDITRFMRTNTATAVGTIVNYVFSYPALLILTGAAALAANENDYMQIMLTLGFGGLAILVLFLATWTTNDTNVYTGALSINLFLPKIPRWKIAAAVGVLGTAFAAGGIFEHFMSWLIFSGNLYGPMAGVYVADYFLNPKRYETTDNIPAFRKSQLISWGFGLFVGLLTTDKESLGFGWITLSTVPMVDAILAAAIMQICLHRMLPKFEMRS